MSQFQVDYRAIGKERPLFPRFMRHPVQTPHIPSKVVSYAFLGIAALLTLIGLIASMSYKQQKQCSFKILLKIIATLACAVVISYGFYMYFYIESYDMMMNTIISGAAALIGVVLLI